MSSDSTVLFGVLILFQVKHCLFDFVFQTSYQSRNKGCYGHGGGILHAGLHAVGSIPALLLAGSAPALFFFLITAEFILHYHIDWFKEDLIARHGWTPDDNRFWQILGVDQLAHQLTYIAMLWFLLP